MTTLFGAIVIALIAYLIGLGIGYFFFGNEANN